MTVFSSPYVYWSIGLVLGVPLLIVTLNELIEDSRKNNAIVVKPLVTIRDILLPMCVLLILFRFVFVVQTDNVTANIISTLFWITLIVVVHQITKLIVGSGDHSEDNWRTYIPHMFLRFPPYTIMGIIVFHIVQDIWSLPIRELATTLGIGSIVVAFALQDTLSNMVSGLLLVANSPFKTGEWVHVGDVEGKIVSVNWRYTNIETWSGDLVVIPNGSIAGESIENHSRPQKPTAVTEIIEIALSNPPNKVKRALIDTMLGTPGVLADPPPVVAVISISDPVVKYEIEFWIEDYSNKPDVLDEFMTRVWYATHRENITFPTPTYELYSHRGKDSHPRHQDNNVDLGKSLEQFAYFSRLPDELKDILSEQARLMHYASSEIIITKGAREQGIYLVLSGAVELIIFDAEGNECILDSLDSRGFFGETGLTGRATSPVTARVIDDAQILLIPHELVNHAINRNANFAEEINTLVERRRLTERRILGDLPPAVATVVPLDHLHTTG
jgi:small-conductance mechanosensitive channel